MEGTASLQLQVVRKGKHFQEAVLVVPKAGLELKVGTWKEPSRYLIHSFWNALETTVRCFE